MPEQWIPKAHQKRGVRFLMSHPNGALLLDPGLGKTTIALAAFKDLRKAGKARRMLVIAPKRPCYHVWTHNEGGELHRWDEFQDLSVTLLHGSNKDTLIQEDSDIYVINFDGLKWLINNNHMHDLLRRDVNVLTIDELSKFKHCTSKRHKMIRPYLPRFKTRWGLTGSPAPNGLMDLFGQMLVIDLGASLGRYITHYRNKYFYSTGYGGYTYHLQDGAEAKIYAAIKPITLSMRAQDHLDMPQLVEQNIWVNLPSTARKVYSEIEDQLITVINSETTTAANAAVASIKCRQIASGGVYADPPDNPDGLPMVEPTKRKVHHIHNEKTEALKDLVDELQGSPLLVVYEFNHDLDRILEAIPSAAVLSGKLSGRHATDMINAWNRGDLAVMCGHPASIGHGLNLQQSGNHVCFYSPPWDFELYDQSMRRVWRQGNKAQRVIVHRILARDTVDEAVVSALAMKGRNQDSLLNALKVYLKKKKGNSNGKPEHENTTMAIQPMPKAAREKTSVRRIRRFRKPSMP